MKAGVIRKGWRWVALISCCMLWGSSGARADAATLDLRQDHRARVATQGSIQGQNHGAQYLVFPSPCNAAYYTPQPQLWLHLDERQNSTLRFSKRAVAQPDYLVVSGPRGVHCFDLAADATPEIPHTGGTYAVYLGTREAGERASFEMVLERVTPEGRLLGALATLVRTSTAHASHEPRRSRTQRRRRSAPASCVDALQRAGYGPAHRRHCRGVSARCAEAVLEAGHGPASLRACRGAEPACADALLGQGYDPADLRQCRGVDRQCALSSLEAGRPPAALRACR